MYLILNNLFLVEAPYRIIIPIFIINIIIFIHVVMTIQQNKNIFKTGMCLFTKFIRTNTYTYKKFLQY